MASARSLLVSFAAATALLASDSASAAERTQKPVLHGRHWVAITGKPLAATAGAVIIPTESPIREIILASLDIASSPIKPSYYKD